MAHIVPSISFIQDLKTNIEQGVSLQQSIQQLVNKPENTFTLKISLWFSYFQKSDRNPVVFPTQYQKSLVEILEQGLNGAPVYEHLGMLEQEMCREFERQWKSYLESLPLKLSLPLLLFFFPAYVILLFGPLLVQFLSGVQ